MATKVEFDIAPAKVVLLSAAGDDHLSITSIGLNAEQTSLLTGLIKGTATLNIRIKEKE
jgi:hypothetical protein